LPKINESVNEAVDFRWRNIPKIYQKILAETQVDDVT